jgi:hypothetical protein
MELVVVEVSTLLAVPTQQNDKAKLVAAVLTVEAVAHCHEAMLSISQGGSCSEERESGSARPLLLPTGGREGSRQQYKLPPRAICAEWVSLSQGLKEASDMAKLPDGSLLELHRTTDVFDNLGGDFLPDIAIRAESKHLVLHF